MVEVTAHSGARPEHAEWQGKIYSRSGKSKKYPDLVKVTGYGTGPGLGGWNCRHSMFPYYEGMGRVYTDEELEELKSKEENDIIEEKELSLEECKNVIEKHNIKFIEEDLKVLDLKLLSDNTKQFDKLLNKYPIMKEYIANKNMHFGAESFANKSTVAAFRNGLDYKNLSIHLSKNKYSSYDSFIKMEQNEVYIFHSMPCADNMLSVYSITHEFGHFIENKFIDEYNKEHMAEFMNMKTRALNAKTISQSKKIFKDWEKKISNEVADQIYDIAKSKNKDFKFKENLSEYGKINSMELFAETFANMECGKPNELGEAMREFLKRKGIV